VALARLAASQHGVVSRAQVVRLGIQGSAIERRVARGRLHRLHRGVFAVGLPHPARDGRLLAAVMAAGPGAAVSHVDAAAAWALMNPGLGAVHVTTPRRSRTGPAGIRLHRVRCLDDDEVTSIRGIPVTTVARTVIDLTDVLGTQRLARVLREADYLRLLDLSAVDGAMVRAHGRKRLANLEAALEIHRPTTVLRSELEHRFLALCRPAGVPEPELNVRIRVGGRSYEVDCLWRRQRLVVELDGATAHETRRAFESDRERDAALVAAGFRSLRYTWRRVARQPEAVMREVRSALALGR
jgi:predicted transcriptional regulator of viral defense system